MENLSPLLAFGGNSRAARSARARLQWRDRYGRFIDMGRGIKFKLNLKGFNSPVSVIGKFVGSTNDPEYGQVYVTGDKNGLPDGFYNVKSSNAAEILATLDPNQLQRSGIQLGRHQDGSPVSSREAEDIQDADSIPYSPYPEGWTKQANGTIGTDDGSFYVQDAGKSNGYALYHNKQFVGYYNHTDWPQILQKSNELDDQEERDENAPATDHVAEAKAAVAPYDDDKGTAAKMIDDGKSGNDILAHLDKNSPAWQQLNNNPGQSRSGIIHPQARQAQRVKNDIKAKAFRAALAKNHGNDRQLISAEDVAVPTAPNKSSDGTTYAVTLHDGSTHRMNRTENDIYTARRNLAVAQRNQNAKATADAQATLDKLEADAGISKPLQTNTPAPKSDTDTSTPAATPTAPASTTPPRNNTPLVQNTNGSAPNAPYVLDPNPYKPTGQDDDPERIAKDFKQTDLQSALSQAVSSGNSHVRLRNSTGQTSNVPAEAIRDAIQRQGSDTNVDLDSDVTINSTAEFDALPEGSQVKYNGELFTKDDKGRWTITRNGKTSSFPNMMYYANLSGRKVILKKDTTPNKSDDNTPAAPTPTPAPAAPAQPVRKAAKDLQPGDEIGGGTIVSVSRGYRTPNGKVDVVYTTPRGVRRTGQWWANTQIGLVNRPQRPVAKLPDNSTPTPAPAAPAAPNTPNAPNLPPGVVRNPNYKPYDGSNTPRTDGKIGFKPSNPAIRSAAQTLLATRIHPTDDPRFDEAVDRLNQHGPDTSDTETQYIINALRTAPMATIAQANAQAQARQSRRDDKNAVPQPAANAPQNPAPTVNPTTPAAPVSNLEDDDEDIYDPNLVFDAIKRKYPNGTETKSGDYVIESRTVTGPKGAQLRYDTFVTRTSNEYFYVYMRETNLTTGDAKSQRVGPMVHSAKALNNRIKAANTILNANRTPDKWFNSKRRRPNIKDDEFNAATGEFEHVKEQPILDSTIKAIHQAVNDDQISEDLIRDVFDTISRFGTSDATLGVIRSQHNLSRNQLNDLIDNINAKVSEQDALSKFQTWVSADGVTPLSEGDIIRHKSGRIGTVQRRIVDHNSKGYEYSDYLFVQFHNSQGVPVGKYTNLTSRNLTLLETADGTDGSERVGPNGVPTPAPTLSTRAQNRKNAIQAALRAHRQRTQAPIPNQQVQINRQPAGNTVTLPDGTTAPMNLTRHHVTADDTPVVKTADQLTPGDNIQIFDGNTGTNRLAQVVQVKPDDNGDVTVTAAAPDDNDPNTATLVGVVTPGMNGTQIQALLNAATTDDDNKNYVTTSDLDRLSDAFRDADFSSLDTQTVADVKRYLGLYSQETYRQSIPKKEVSDLIARLQAGPQRPPIAPAQNLNAAINIAQSVVDDSDDDATGLQNSIDSAKIKSDRVNTPQGRVQAIIAENSVVHDLSDYNKIGSAQGSNPGGTYQEIGPGGRKIYLKEQTDQAHADNEVLASALYRATGMNAVTVLHGDHPTINKPVTFSPLISLDPNKNLNSALRDPAMRAKIQNGFAVDAWLANWDSTLNGNIDFDMSGNPVHVDVGGAIQFRATGPRRTNFDDNVDELKTLRDPRYNAQAAAVYGSMTQAEQEQSARQLLNVTDADIDALVSSTTKNSLSPQDQQALATTLKNRRANILKAYNIDPNGTSNTTAAPAAQAPTPAPAAPANPVKPNVPVLNIRTKQDANGVHYPTRPLTSLQLGALRRGTAQPPSLPFKTFDTDSGEVHYYDTTGTRRWGQYGAAGAMLRRQRADGTYEYLLAQRASTLSTGANLWSVPSGAHDTKADAGTPGLTAGRELSEELGIDPSTVTYAGDYTSQPAPDWGFNYSFYDVKPGEYDTPPQVDPAEIQATRWVSQDEMKQMFDDGEMHDSITQGIFDGIHNTSAGLPSQAPNAPAQAPQAPAAPAAPAAPTNNASNGTPVKDSSFLDSSPVGQRMYYVGDNDYVEEYEKQSDGKWVASYISSSPNTAPDDTDLTEVLKNYIDTNPRANFFSGSAPRGNTPAASAAPAASSPLIPDGQFLTGPSNIDSMPPGQRISLSKNGDIVVYEKQSDGVWHAVNSNVNGYPIDDSDKTANLQTGLARSPQNYVTGDLITPGAGGPKTPAPAGHKPVPDGQQVDEQWINTAPAGQAANLTNPITGQPQQLTKLSNGMWTDGSRMYSGTALSNFNKGRSPLLAGGIPKPPEPGPEDGQIATASWMDNAPTGAKVHFMSSTGDQYTVTKRADGEWDVEDPQNGYPAVRKSSSMRTMAANGKVTIGPKPDLNQPAPPKPATPTQTALDDLLSTVDPDGRFSSRIAFTGKSDAELTDILNDVRAKTGGQNPLTDADLADLVDKYVPKTPQSIEDYFDRFDEIDARVKQLKADARGGDPKKQHANYLLAAISEMNGHNALPEIVDSVNDLRGDKIYRGVSDVRGLSAEEMLNQYQTASTQYAGAGTFGDGTYTSTDKSTAKSYAGYGSGRIMTAALNPADMKLFKIRGYGGYSSLFQQQKAAFESKIKSYLTSHGFQPGTAAYRKKMADMTALFSERSSAWSHQGPFDLGVMLSMQGYDAIQVDHGGEYFYVVLNRGKLQIVRKSEKA